MYMYIHVVYMYLLVEKWTEFRKMSDVTYASACSTPRGGCGRGMCPLPHEPQGNEQNIQLFLSTRELST